MSNNTILNIFKCKEILQKKFPKAKVEYELGALHVTYSDGYMKYVDSYKAIDGKLRCFATIEMEE
jgi:hypothetical protein